MKIAEFSVKHSLFVNLISVFLVVAGGFSMFRLNREVFPIVSFDVVTIQTIYKGADPQEVEKLITAPLEKELKGVDSIEEMNSVSSEGLSSIVLKIDPDTHDKRKVVDDIQKAVDQVKDLPQDAERPVVNEVTSKHIPVIIISLSANMERRGLQDAAEHLEDMIQELDGVASVARRGWQDREFWVECGLEKMKVLHVSLDEVMRSLKNRNVGLAAGKHESDNYAFSIRTSGEFFSKEEINDVVIRGNDAGNWLKVKDVAQVVDTFEEEKVINRAGGFPAVALIAIKKEKADAVKLVDDIKKTIEEFKKGQSPELKVDTFSDLSFYIKRRLNVLKNNGFFGFLLVLATLFLFLHKVPAILTAIGIPIAMLTTFLVMSLFGMTINLITMFGLIVVLGMLVDDGIIITENVYRYVEQGLPPREAVIKGAGEVMAPVFSTVLTTIAAFTPLMFMTGLLGRFIRCIPYIICIALSASLIEAFFILPSHLADFIKPGSQRIIEQKKGSGWLKRIISGYEKNIGRALRYRYFVCLAIVILFFLSLFVAGRYMKFILFSGRGVEQFMIRAEAELGTPLSKTSQLIRPVEELVAGIPKEYVDTFQTEVGEISEERGFDPDSKSGPHLAQITVYLTPSQKRRKTAEEIMEEYRPGLKQAKGFEKLYFRKMREGPPVGKAVYARVRGEDYTLLNTIASRMSRYLAGLPGVGDISTDYDMGNRELRVMVDEEKAKSAYLAVSNIASSVRNAFEGGDSYQHQTDQGGKRCGWACAA